MTNKEQPTQTKEVKELVKIINRKTNEWLDEHRGETLNHSYDIFLAQAIQGAGYTKSVGNESSILKQLKVLDKEFVDDEVFGFAVRGKLTQWESLSISPEIKLTLISDGKMMGLVTDYYLSGKNNRHILAKQVAHAQLVHNEQEVRNQLGRE
jgi:hypothetical protein